MRQKFYTVFVGALAVGVLFSAHAYAAFPTEVMPFSGSGQLFMANSPVGRPINLNGEGTEVEGRYLSLLATGHSQGDDQRFELLYDYHYNGFLMTNIQSSKYAVNRNSSNNQAFMYEIGYDSIADSAFNRGTWGWGENGDGQLLWLESNRNWVMSADNPNVDWSPIHFGSSDSWWNELGKDTKWFVNY